MRGKGLKLNGISLSRSKDQEDVPAVKDLRMRLFCNAMSRMFVVGFVYGGHTLRPA